MLLSRLLSGLIEFDPALDRDLTGLAQNSQQVQPGYLFLACSGRSFDGRHYIQEAIANGASAVLMEAGGEMKVATEIPVIAVAGLNQYLEPIAARFFNNPANQLQLIGVTGTNGKTSCTQFIAQILQKLDPACGVIGTLGSGMWGSLKTTLMTTPDTIQLQKIFSECRAQKAKYIAMEVSSHSLDQERIKGLEFQIAVFTNLSQDHLDYHGNMENYAAAKKRFFFEYPMHKVVINADDAFGRELIALLPSEKVISYSARTFATITAQNPQFALSGLSANIFTPWGEGELKVPLVGEFNLSNVLAVLATLGALGFPLPLILSSLTQLQSVPGRMQIFGGGIHPQVIVDYAHTPDALEKALSALRRHCEGRLFCIFGCGGERDKSKRPLMGAIAEKYADKVMLTNDNPRHEKPEVILKEILAGMKYPQQASLEANRSKAIQDIIQCAKPGDYVLVAGKGAETFQQIGDEKLPFNDGEKIVEILGI